MRAEDLKVFISIIDFSRRYSLWSKWHAFLSIVKEQVRTVLVRLCWIVARASRPHSLLRAIRRGGRATKC